MTNVYVNYLISCNFIKKYEIMYEEYPSHDKTTTISALHFRRFKPASTCFNAQNDILCFYLRWKSILLPDNRKMEHFIITYIIILDSFVYFSATHCHMGCLALCQRAILVARRTFATETAPQLILYPEKYLLVRAIILSENDSPLDFPRVSENG